MKTSMNSRSREEGFALLAVLVILVILALLASSVALTTERAVADMQGRIDDESFRRDAFSTQETLAYLLVTQRVTIAGLTVDDQVRDADGSLRPMSAEDIDEGVSPLPIGNEIRLDGTPYRGVGRAVFALQDGRGLLSPNWSPWFVRQAWTESLGGEPNRWPDLEARLHDYQDGDDLLRPNGAERREYTRAGRLPPANRPLTTPLELREVSGWSPLLADVDDATLAQRMTVTRDTFVNINTAPAETLALVPGVGPTSAERAVDLRANNPWTTTWSFAAAFGVRRDDVREALFLFPNGTGTLTLRNEGVGPGHLVHWTLTGADEGGYPWRLDYDFLIPRPDEGATERIRPPPTILFSAPLPDRG